MKIKYFLVDISCLHFITRFLDCAPEPSSPSDISMISVYRELLQGVHIQYNMGSEILETTTNNPEIIFSFKINTSIDNDDKLQLIFDGDYTPGYQSGYPRLGIFILNNMKNEYEGKWEYLGDYWPWDNNKIFTASCRSSDYMSNNGEVEIKYELVSNFRKGSIIKIDSQYLRIE